MIYRRRKKRLPTEQLNENEERSSVNSSVKLDAAALCADMGKHWETNEGLLGHWVWLN